MDRRLLNTALGLVLAANTLSLPACGSSERTGNVSKNDGDGEQVPVAVSGATVREAVEQASHVRLRPILMTSLATIIGLAPLAFQAGTGGEAYAALARAVIGGLAASVLLTIYIVPAAYLLVYGRRQESEARS